MNNSEILYLYDAMLTNPNGDPDEENRPRMDYERDVNLVTDLRLKRYIRDYLADQNYELFVQKMEGKSVTAADRIEALKASDEATILDKLIDVRLFGATMPITGDNKTFIGPVQFNWGYSLNKVELVEASITSHFASDSKNSQGAIGKDYRVKYSLIAFSGVISGLRAKKTKLSDTDVTLLDKAMRYAIPLQATRSKIGQYPRLYIRVEYKDNQTILGDMRGLVELKEKAEHVRNIHECSLKLDNLVEKLNKNSDCINKIVYYQNDGVRCMCGGNEKTVEEIFDKFTLEKVQ